MGFWNAVLAVRGCDETETNERLRAAFTAMGHELSATKPDDATPPKTLSELTEDDGLDGLFALLKGNPGAWQEWKLAKTADGWFALLPPGMMGGVEHARTLEALAVHARFPTALVSFIADSDGFMLNLLEGGEKKESAVFGFIDGVDTLPPELPGWRGVQRDDAKLSAFLALWNTNETFAEHAAQNAAAHLDLPRDVFVLRNDDARDWAISGALWTKSSGEADTFPEDY